MPGTVTRLQPDSLDALELKEMGKPDSVKNTKMVLGVLSPLILALTTLAGVTTAFLLDLSDYYQAYFQSAIAKGTTVAINPTNFDAKLVTEDGAADATLTFMPPYFPEGVTVTGAKLMIQESYTIGRSSRQATSSSIPLTLPDGWAAMEEVEVAVPVASFPSESIIVGRYYRFTIWFEGEQDVMEGETTTKRKHRFRYRATDWWRSP